MRVLASHADYQITPHRAEAQPTDLILVTFGGQPSDLAHRGFGTDFALKQGWDTIYVAQRYGTQYQGLSVQAFRDAVAPVAEGRDAVCYGPSLGGYAAFYYGGSIDARIIAGAPMLPAWHRFANRAYAELTITHGDLSEGPLSSKPPVVIYDPTLLRDQLMVEGMIRPAYPALRTVEYLHAGHTVLVTLQNTHQLKGLIAPPDCRGSDHAHRTAAGRQCRLSSHPRQVAAGHRPGAGRTRVAPVARDRTGPQHAGRPVVAPAQARRDGQSAVADR